MDHIFCFVIKDFLAEKEQNEVIRDLAFIKVPILIVYFTPFEVVTLAA